MGGILDGVVPSKDQPPRGSLHSIRKGSYDVKSLASESGQSLRRQSLAKLNSLPIEAPITKVITLLYSAHEQSSPSIQAQLDKVVDILRSTELYSPQLKENRIRPDDPVTVDLISALLSVIFFLLYTGILIFEMVLARKCSCLDYKTQFQRFRKCQGSCWLQTQSAFHQCSGATYIRPRTVTRLGV